MAESIKIKLDASQYRLPTQDDVRSAKQFVLRREEFSRLLGSKIDDCLSNMAEEITRICYKYNVEPTEFTISSQYDENMMSEIAEVMDNTEEEILSLIYDYSTQVTENREHKNLLAAWIALLGRGNRNLQDTLDGYLYKSMKDVEAAIAAMRYADVEISDAITKVKTNLHSIYTMPEVVSAFRNANDFNATYIRSRGVMAGGVGLSNNGSTNVTNMARITLQMAWMREQGIEFANSGASGYYQLRGSLYPCSICDDEVGFHEDIEEIHTKPLPHPHCCCYRIPVFSIGVKQKEEYKINSIKEERDIIRSSGEMLINDELESYQNLYTGKILRSNKVLERLLSHSYNSDELNAAKFIWNNPNSLVFDRVSPLGEVKDMNKEENIRNISAKRRRKITQYLIYSFNYNGKRWLIKTEQHKRGFEQFYSFYFE